MQEEINVQTSGGTLAYNFREGLRSERLIHYALSAFGPATPVLREDDHGIDLICHLAQREGKIAIVGSAYGVQVKSGESVVEYKGPQACEWLQKLQFPLFVATVDKSSSSVKIYSTWNLHLFLFPFQHDSSLPKPEKIILIASETEQQLEKPNISTGEVPIGHPILDFRIEDLGNSDLREKYREIMDEWVGMDRNNYNFRLAGISIAYGYIKWKTNMTLSESSRTWYRPHYFSPATCDKARELLSDLATVIALHQGNVRDRSTNKQQIENARSEVELLRSYLQQFCEKYLDNFKKKIFAIE